MTMVFHPAAREEARQAFLYYSGIDQALADDFEKRVANALNEISNDPLRHRVRRFAVRRYNLLRFKLYYIAYMIWREEIVVIAIGHASKRPYYWYRRPKDYRDTH